MSYDTQTCNECQNPYYDCICPEKENSMTNSEFIKTWNREVFYFRCVVGLNIPGVEFWDDTGLQMMFAIAKGEK